VPCCKQESNHQKGCFIMQRKLCALLLSKCEVQNIKLGGLQAIVINAGFQMRILWTVSTLIGPTLSDWKKNLHCIWRYAQLHCHSLWMALLATHISAGRKPSACYLISIRHALPKSACHVHESRCVIYIDYLCMATVCSLALTRSMLTHGS